MYPEFLLDRFVAYDYRPAFIWQDREYTYDWLRKRIEQLALQLDLEGVQGKVVSLEEDYSPDSIAALFALLVRRCIIIPLDRKLVEAHMKEYLNIAEVQVRIQMDNGIAIIQEEQGKAVQHPLLISLLQEGSAGLVLFSSGSSGKSKAAVHHVGRLLEKFRLAGRANRTIPFMMFDHIGGMNTMLQTLSSGGCLFILQERSPAEVCRTIERYQVEALPTSPTFMNLLLLSGAYRDYDLSSLKVVSYGSEVMPAHILSLWNLQFPAVRTIQAYGMSELGVLRTRSKSPDSLLFSIAESGTQYRIVDNMLELKSSSAMLGYLNAPDPFTADGWLQTGDEAIVEGEYIRILGRRSEMINVGGEKVYPAEVESVLQQIANIEEVVVSAEPSGITGQLVKATVRLHQEQSLQELRHEIREFCSTRLSTYKIPQKIVVTTEPLISNRMKKIRNINSDQTGSKI